MTGRHRRLRAAASGNAGTRRRRLLSKPVIGIVAAVVGVGALVASFEKLHIEADLQSGHILNAVFASDYDNLIRPDWTKVDVAGVAVGVVTNLRVTRRGAAIVSMKVHPHAWQSLGTAPTATLDLVTLLGGNVMVALHPGGRPGTPAGAIPPARTTTPVYLGRVLDAFTPQARQGIQTAVTQLDKGMAAGGTQAAGSLVATAPGALVPTAGALGALQGPQPGDLASLVRNLDAVTTTLAGGNGQLQAILHDAGAVSATVASQSGALGTTVAQLPAALAQAQQGLADLQAVLAHLRSVAGPLTPSAQPLAQLLAQAQPTLAAALPVVDGLSPVLAQADPVLAQLAPTASSLTSFLGDVRGPVLHRILNPLVPDLLERYRGAAKTVYQEVGYALAGLDGAGEMTDHTGPVINFNEGANAGVLRGVPITEPLSYHNYPKGS